MLVDAWGLKVWYEREGGRADWGTSLDGRRQNTHEDGDVTTRSPHTQTRSVTWALCSWAKSLTHSRSSTWTPTCWLRSQVSSEGTGSQGGRGLGGATPIGSDVTWDSHILPNYTRHDQCHLSLPPSPPSLVQSRNPSVITPSLLIPLVGLALLSQLVVLKLNSNRLGEECTFTLRRMAEKNADPCGCG